MDSLPAGLQPWDNAHNIYEETPHEMKKEAAPGGLLLLYYRLLR